MEQHITIFAEPFNWIDCLYKWKWMSPHFPFSYKFPGDQVRCSIKTWWYRSIILCVRKTYNYRVDVISYFAYYSSCCTFSMPNNLYALFGDSSDWWLHATSWLMIQLIWPPNSIYYIDKGCSGLSQCSICIKWYHLKEYIWPLICPLNISEDESKVEEIPVQPYVFFQINWKQNLLFMSTLLH